MIAHVEKGAGLHAAIRAAGHWLLCIDGVWQSDDDVAVQAIIDAYDPRPAAQAEAEARIDAAAGAARARYITVAPGQEATYQIKEAQARAYLASGTVGIMLAAEADATGQTPAAVAAVIVATADAWIGLAAQIEAARMAGKAQARAAADWIAIAGIADAAVAALEAL